MAELCPAAVNGSASPAPDCVKLVWNCQVFDVPDGAVHNEVASPEAGWSAGDGPARAWQRRGAVRRGRPLAFRTNTTPSSHVTESEIAMKELHGKRSKRLFEWCGMNVHINTAFT